MSIFDLKTSVSQLESSNHGISKLSYDQITPTRDVTSTNFANGAISFKWFTSGVRWCVPARSYLRARVSLTKDGTNPLKLADDVAPNMDQFSALFQSAEVRLNDKTISRIADYMPQIDALDSRISKSKSWIDSVGNSTNFWQKNFSVRQVETAKDGRLNDKLISSSLASTDIGYTGTTSVQVTATTVVLTVSVPPTVPFKSGDFIEIDIPGTTSVRYKIAGVATSGGPPVDTHTLTLSEVAPTLVDGVRAFRLIRNSPVENISRNVSTYEIIWTPPLSFFKIQHAIPAGAKLELLLNPQTASVYPKAVCESVIQDRTPGTDFQISIVDMYLYVNVVDGSRVDSMTYYLDLEQIACQTESMLGATSFGQKNYDVSPSTKSLVMAFQDIRAGTNTLYSNTKFRSYPVSPALPASSQDQGLLLNRLFFNYAGMNYPQPDASPSFVPSQDYTTQRYVDSLMASGSYNDNGGSETIEDFHDRGSYYMWNCSKDGSDRSTRVAVHTGFQSSPAPDLSNTRMLLFSISSQVCKVVVENGNVTSVDLTDV